jgi:site-specific recombinase XerD
MSPIDGQDTTMDSHDGARRWGPIIVDGQLAPFADGVRRELAGQGYALDTVGDHVHLLADLSDWLSAQGLDSAGLTTEVVEEFLRARRTTGRHIGVTGRAVAPILGYLRRLQVAPPHAVVAATTPQDVLLAEYRHHLEGERGLSAGTVTHYLRCARAFLEWLPGSHDSVSGLSAGQVIGYVMQWTRRRDGRPPDMVTLPALRSFLRFLHVAGHIPGALADAVPAGRAHPARLGGAQGGLR